MAQFKTTTRVRFREVDSGGILFFANIFRLAHDAYEQFIDHLGYSYEDWFANNDFAFPIRHCEADYTQPLFPGRDYEISVQIDKIGTTSFVTRYIFTYDKKVVNQVKIAHTYFNIRAKTKASLPLSIRERLEAYQRQS